MKKSKLTSLQQLQIVTELTALIKSYKELEKHNPSQLKRLKKNRIIQALSIILRVVGSAGWNNVVGSKKIGKKQFESVISELDVECPSVMSEVFDFVNKDKGSTGKHKVSDFFTQIKSVPGITRVKFLSDTEVNIDTDIKPKTNMLNKQVVWVLEQHVSEFVNKNNLTIVE